METFTACEASQGTFGLAESPAWDARNQRALWVDIAAGTMHEGELVEESVVETLAFTADSTVGAVLIAESGERVVAGATDLLTVRRDGSRVSSRPVIGPDRHGRLNDAKVDPWGRILVGTASFRPQSSSEVLLREETDGTFTVIDDALTLANGIAWSPAGDVIYYVDSLAGTVWARDYGLESLGERRRHVSVDSGIPDGMCMDSSGDLWIAVWGAGEVLRFDGSGRLLARVSVPADNPTSVAFVGPAMDALLITAANDTLFTARVGVSGLPPTLAAPSKVRHADEAL